MIIFIGIFSAIYVSNQGSVFHKLTEKIEKIKNIKEDLDVKHEKQFKVKKNSLELFNTYGEQLRFVHTKLLDYKPKTKYQGEFKIDIDTVSTDEFSISGIIIVQNMKLLKGVKNIFDFKCVEVMEKDVKKILVESYENS